MESRINELMSRIKDLDDSLNLANIEKQRIRENVNEKDREMEQLRQKLREAQREHDQYVDKLRIEIQHTLRAEFVSKFFRQFFCFFSSPVRL